MQTSRRQLRLLACLLCFSFAIPHGALAQTNAPATLAPEAQAAVDKGVLAAKQQDYLLAVRYFQDARKLAPKAPEIYFDLGLAESKIPGRELRAIAWFGAYLATVPNAENRAAVQAELDRLHVKNQSGISLLIKTVQDAANQTAHNKEYSLVWVAGLWAEAGDLPTALQTVELIPDSDRKISALVGIAEIQVNADVRAGALQTLATARKIADQTGKADWHFASGQSNAYHAVAEAQAKAGGIAAAQQTADLIQEVFHKCLTELAIAQVQIKTSDFAGANRTLRAAENCADLIQEVFHKCSTELAIAQAQIKTSDFADANRTLRAAENCSELEGSGEDRIGIASAKIQTGDLEGARQTLLVARKFADSMPTSSSDEANLKANRLGAIFELQAAAGDIAGARQTLAAGIKAMDLMTNGANRLPELILVKDYVGNLRKLVNSRIKTGDIAGAKEIADLVVDPAVKSFAQDDIAEAQANAGDFVGAQNTADSILAGTYGKARALQAITGARVKAAQLQLKAGDFAGALKTADLVQDAGLKNQTLSEIATAQLKAGDIDGALKTSDLIQDVELKSKSQLVIAAAQAAAGDLRGTQETLALVFKAAETIHDPAAKSDKQCAISAVQLKSGDLSGARETLLAALKSADSIPDLDARSNQRSSIAGYQVTAGDIAGAQKTLDQIQFAKHKIYPYWEIAEAQIKEGDVAKAHRTLTSALKNADLIQDSGQKTSALCNIAYFQVKAGDTAGAEQTLALAMKNIDLTPDPKWKAYGLTSVAEVQVIAGNITGAKMTVAAGLKIADLIQDPFTQGLALRGLAQSQAKTGDIAGAQEAALLIENKDLRNGAQTAIAEIQAKSGTKASPATAVPKPKVPQPSAQPASAAQAQPAVPAITVSDWLDKLDETGTYSDCALNTLRFLDLTGYLKSLSPSDNPQEIFDNLRQTAKAIIVARNIMDRMLKQEALQ